MPVPVDVEVDGIMSDDMEGMAGASDLEDLEHDELATQSIAAKGSNAANSNILQCFWGLASVDEEERTSNALALLSHLRTAQSKRKEKGTLSDELTYCLRRLVRGLASSRQGARQGFALVLTELMRAFEEVEVKNVLDIMEETMAVTGSMKGQEERDNFFGRVFGLASVLQSGRCYSNDADAEVVGQIVTQLINLSTKKSYLREPALQIVAGVADAAPQGMFVKAVLPHLKELFAAPEWTAETLAIALAMQQNYPTIEYKEIFAQWKKPSKLLHVKNFRHFQGIMLQAGDVNRPSLHVAWKYALAGLNGDTLTAFWHQVVDEGLFAAGSHERKFTGLQLFELLLNRLGSKEVPQLFSQNVMRTLVNNAGNDKTFLHKAALHALACIRECGQQDGDKAMVMVSQLLGPYGSHHFDRLSKTNTVQTLVTNLSAEGVQSYVALIMDSFSAPPATPSQESEERRVHLYREWAADQLVSLVRNQHIPKQEAWVMSVMRFLFLHAFYRQVRPVQSATLPELARKGPSPALTMQTHDMCAQRVFSLLGELSSWLPSTGVSDADTTKALDADNHRHSHALDGTMIDGEFWVYRLHEVHRELITLEDGADDKSALSLVRTLGDRACQSHEDVLEIIRKIRLFIEKKKGTAGAKARAHGRAFELLCLHTSILLLKDQEEFTDVIGDLKQCFTREFEAKPVKTPKKKAKAVVGEEEDAEPEAIEVLTDVLLALLAKPSALLRVVCEHVFRIYCDQLTSAALDLILQVLMVDPTKGSSELFESIEDDDGEQARADEMSEDDKDEKEEGSEKEASEEEGAESDEEEVESEDEDEDDLSEDEQLRSKLRDVLGNAAINMDEDASDSELSDLDDDQMAVFDEKLSEVFKNRKSFKSEKRDALKAMLDFKLRTVDLLEIFIKKQPSNPLVLEIIMPALDAVRTVPKQNQYRVLQERLEGLIRNKLCRLREVPRPPAIDLAIPHTLLEELFKAANKAPTKRHLGIIASCILLTIRVCVGSHKADPSPLKTRGQRKHDDHHSDEEPLGQLDPELAKRLYGEALVSLVSKKNTPMHLSFFSEAFRRYPALGALMIEPAVSACQLASKPYAHTQAFALLECLAKLPGLSAEHARTLLSKAQPYIESALGATEDEAFKAKHFKELTRHFVAMLTATQRVLKGELNNALNVDTLTATLNKLCESPTARQAPSVERSVKQALRILNPNASVAAKKKKDRRPQPAAPVVVEVPAAASDEPTKPAETHTTPAAKQHGKRAVPAAKTPKSAKKQKKET